jgi:hypothetical protein
MGNNWLTLVFGLVTVVGLSWYWQDRRQQVTSGLMKPQSTAFPRYIGVGGVLLEMHTRDGILLRDGDEPLVSVRIVDGRMLVTAKMKNERGDLVAEMKDNVWTHQPRPAIFDRNYNDDVLEIRDAAGRVALQVADFGETVELAGVFHCSKDSSSYVLGPADDGGAIIEVRPPGAKIDYQIPSICDYPSQLNLGSCPGATRLARLAKNRSAYPVRTTLEVCRADAARHTR